MLARSIFLFSFLANSVGLGQSQKPEDIKKNMMHVVELMKKYEIMSGDPLPRT